MISRQQRRAAQRKKVASPKHSVVLQEREGMPLETSAECLSDPTLKTTNTFRKECWRSRATVYTPAQRKFDTSARKIGEKNFSQLGKGFRRSYAKRFKHIPKRVARLEKLKSTADAEAVKKICEPQSALVTVAGFHDQRIILINREIAKRHLRRLG